MFKDFFLSVLSKKDLNSEYPEHKLFEVTEVTVDLNSDYHKDFHSRNIKFKVIALLSVLVHLEWPFTKFTDNHMKLLMWLNIRIDYSWSSGMVSF